MCISKPRCSLYPRALGCSSMPAQRAARSPGPWGEGDQHQCTRFLHPIPSCSCVELLCCSLLAHQEARQASRKKIKIKLPCWKLVPDQGGGSWMAEAFFCPNFFPWPHTTPEAGARHPPGTDPQLWGCQGCVGAAVWELQGIGQESTAPRPPHLSAPVVILFFLLAHPAGLFADGGQGLVAGAVVPPPFLERVKKSRIEPS